MVNFYAPPRYVLYRHPILFLDISLTNKEGLFLQRVNYSVVRVTPEQFLKIPHTVLKSKTIYYIQEEPKDLCSFIRKLQHAKIRKPNYKIIGNVSVDNTFSLHRFLQICHGILQEKSDIERWLHVFQSANYYPFYLDPDLHSDVVTSLRSLPSLSQGLDSDVNEFIVNKEQLKKY